MLGRLREIIDWKFILAAAFLMLVVQMGFNSWSDAKTNESLVTQLEAEQARSAVDRKQASEERTRLVEGQRQLRRDYQLLLDYLEDEGVTIPPNLARAIVAGSGRTNNDDDDDGGTTRIEVRPNSGSTSSPSSSPSPSGGGSSDPPNVVEELPKQIGGTVDDTRKQIEDLTDGLGSMVELP